MNQQQRDALGQLITATAMYYSKPVTREVVTMMIDDLQDLSFETVQGAYQKYRRDPKNKFFPLPAQIREIVSPVISVEVQARELIERIKIAITRFGYMRANEAQIFIGPEGWNIVRGLGGWARVCESNFIHNSALIAQARARGEDLINFQGNIGTAAMLDFSGEEQQQIEYSGDYP